ncbi:MAG: hypothetical protein ABIS12_18005 [Bacteroidia bacterium]
MTTKIHIALIGLVIFAGSMLHAQVTVTNASLTPLNITPASICQVTLINAQGAINVALRAAVYNSAGELLIEVKTTVFNIHSGVNVLQAQSLGFASVAYAPSTQGKFVQAQHQLPSGAFKHCVYVINLGGEVDDEYCQDLESDNNSFLNLILPFDRDTIDTKTPLLTWTHSEPFNLLSPGESFRLVLVKLNDGQDAEAAVTANSPLFISNNLFRHELQYPFDATALKEGESYAWQVQKLSAGGQGVVNKTDAWQFTIRKPKEVKDNKYAVLKRKLDAGFYTTTNNKLFFRFDEEYGGNNISCVIYDEQRKKVNPEPDNETQKEAKQTSVLIKSNGYNRYEINLEELNLKSGYYFLEVFNEKKEKFTLKFYVE